MQFCGHKPRYDELRWLHIEGGPPKGFKVPEEEKDYEIKRLQRENELLQFFFASPEGGETGKNPFPSKAVFRMALPVLPMLGADFPVGLL